MNNGGAARTLAEIAKKDFALTPRASQFVFVYGTLQSSYHNPAAKRLRAGSQLVGAARVPGRLRSFGYFPGLILDPGARNGVHGEIYRLLHPALLAHLDAYEGCAPHSRRPHLYRRELAEAQLYDGGRVWAWLYVLNDARLGAPLLAPRFQPNRKIEFRPAPAD
ncbi:MAG: gamma-glutamylcyclotransferase family protein [Hyphomicrobiales bacterium]|nr:gamma-glutamylcyclotransferase family protein [Hyphomicrobiales bacterium]